MKKSLFVITFASFIGGLAHATNSCTGATYYDAATDTCIACPTGYDYNKDAGKTSINQCQIQCDGGTYVKNPGAAVPPGYTPLEYLMTTGTQYIDTGITADVTTKVDMDVSFGSVSETYVIIGTRKGSNITDENVFQWGALVNKTFNRFGMGGVSGDQIYADTLYSVHIEDGLQTVKNGADIIATTNFEYNPNMDTAGTLYMFCTHDTTTSDGTNFFAPTNTYIKNLQITKGGAVVRNFIPAKNSSNVIGMYDTVSGNFFENQGTDSFMAGPIIDSCSNVGVGYWAAASTVNFGSVGTRNACPIGTYSSINNGVSVADCLDCTGATYNDEPAAATCKVCPAGYVHNTTAGKTSINQCQIHCNAGTYIEIPGATSGYTRVEYIQNAAGTYINTGIIPDIDGIDDVEMNIRYYCNTTSSNYIFQSRATSGGQIYGLSGSSSGATILGNWNSNSNGQRIQSTIKRVVGHVYNLNLRLYDGTMTLHVIDETTGEESIGSINYTWSVPQSPFGIFGNTGGNRIATGNRVYSAWIKVGGQYVMYYVPVTNNGIAGFYDTVSQTFKGATAGSLTAGTVLQNDTQCINVGAGYYAPESTVNYGSVGTRNACPVGLTTVGYGHGADSANDCGRTLHVGDNVLYMRKNKETSPAIHIQMENGDMFYVNLSPTNHNISKLHLWHNGGEYTAYDDSLFYNERDFITGAQTTP